MTIDLKKMTAMFKNAYSDKIDMWTNPNRAEEYKLYTEKFDKEIANNQALEAKIQTKIDLLPPLAKGKYKVKALRNIQGIGFSVSKGRTGILYNAGPSEHRGSLNANQDPRAIVFDYGMSGTDNFYPTIDFEIVEYLGEEK